MQDYIKTLPTAALYTFVIYIFLVLGFRVLGRRQLGQLTVVDLVVIIVMGSAVETALIGGNVSLPAGFVSAGTLLLADRLFALIFSRSKRLRHLLGGGPLLLVHYGHPVEEHLRRAGLTKADLEEAIRERDCAGIADVKFAVLEEDGEINIVQNTAPTYQTQRISSKTKPIRPPAPGEVPIKTELPAKSE